MIALWSIALLTGITGSLHCLGMCGPLALALPVGSFSKQAIWLSRLWYNAGRILTYSLLGFVTGYVGKVLSITIYQQEISILVGCVMLLLLLRKPIVIAPAFFVGIGKLLRKIRPTQPIQLIVYGIINGLLPCGIVYVALAGAMASTSPLQGALFMAFFGLGTTPMMLSVSLATTIFKPKVRIQLNKYLPYYTIFMGIFFIIRGLNLGIPYLSPQFSTPKANTQKIAVCGTHP